MNHSEHDLDLIASYASDDPQDRELAESLVASCPECASEYSSQAEVRRLLASLGMDPLTEMEATRLTRAVMSKLPAAPATRPGRTVSPWWGRVSAVAAAAAGVVLVASVLSSTGGQGAATTTTAFAAELSADAPAATTAAAAESMAGMAAAEGSYEDLVAQAEELTEEAKSSAGDSAQRSSAAIDSCPELDELDVLASADAVLNGRPVVIVVVADDPEPRPRAFYLDDCSEIELS